MALGKLYLAAHLYHRASALEHLANIIKHRAGLGGVYFPSKELGGRLVFCIYKFKHKCKELFTFR